MSRLTVGPLYIRAWTKSIRLRTYALDEAAIEKRAQFSAIGTLINMDDAFYAADRIPENMTAHEAPNQFVHFVCGPEKAEVPEWFARG